MSEFLSRLSDDLAQVVKDAGQSVVRVEARRRLPATGIVWSADGVIVSAQHVVQREDNINISLPSGQIVPAQFVGRDPTTDIAVVRAQATGLRPSILTAPDDLRVGHLVLALGRPGQTVQATMGIVSALGKTWRTPAGGLLDHYLQTDLVMYPGFSGGPLVDVNGQVRGVNTSALVRGVSLAVPALTLQTVVETLLVYGKMRQGYLGVGAQPARLPEALAQQLGQETGLLVMSVNPASPADKAGLLLGDTITGMDSEPVRQMDDLLNLLAGDRVGDAVPLRIVRGGQMQELTIVIGERP